MPYKDIIKRRQYDNKKYHQQRNELIEKLGGKCINCESLDNLQFDHIDPSKKALEIHINLRVRYTLEQEIDKIQILCENCHKNKTKRQHRERAKRKHGQGRTAYNNCGPPKCDKCKEWNKRSNGGYRLIPR